MQEVFAVGLLCQPVQDGRAVTQGLDSLQHVRSLMLEHVKVDCLPPQLEALRLVRCRLKHCPLPRGWRLQSLIIDSCTGQVSQPLCCPWPMTQSYTGQEGATLPSLAASSLALVHLSPR